MPTALDMQKAQMAQRMGAAPGGLANAGGSPPPAGMNQQPSGAAPQSSRLEPLLQQVLQILVDGNPADLEAFGRFMAQLEQLVQGHNMGQGQMPQQGTPTPNGGMV